MLLSNTLTLPFWLPPGQVLRPCLMSEALLTRQQLGVRSTASVKVTYSTGRPAFCQRRVRADTQTQPSLDRLLRKNQAIPALAPHPPLSAPGTALLVSAAVLTTPTPQARKGEVPWAPSNAMPFLGISTVH